MNSLEALLTIAFLTSILNIDGNDAIPAKCDFRRHPKTGCDSSAVCDPKQKQCVCRIGFILTMNGECLRARPLNETCISSLQCRTAHSACLAVDGTYNAWKCQCLQGFWLDKSTGRCIERYRFGQHCINDQQCRIGLTCAENDQNSANNQTVCKCPPEYHFNGTRNECQHFNNSGCPQGQTWNRYNKKCEANHYSNRSGIEANGKHNAVIKNKLLRPSTYWTQTTNPAKDEDTDQKILEIILEISFLIVCLLAYQACSKACCPDTDDDDFDVKSDEESMISTSHASQLSVNGQTVGPTATAFKKHHRRVRKVFCKSKGNSTQKLIGSSPIHKYKNIIVKFDDTSRAQCYNCKIYKEVYSPTAKCKVCRASITANAPDPELDYIATDGKQLLPLPPYKLKPIRRSEEVGVPPHLKAPYINNQPFWLK